MTLCYFCQESFTPGESEHICNECVNNLRSQFEKHVPSGLENLTPENMCIAFNNGFHDFAQELPKRFAQLRWKK